MHAICTYILPKFKQAAARSLCDSWASCLVKYCQQLKIQCYVSSLKAFRCLFIHVQIWCTEFPTVIQRPNAVTVAAVIVMLSLKHRDDGIACIRLCVVTVTPFHVTRNIHGSMFHRTGVISLKVLHCSKTFSMLLWWPWTWPDDLHVWTRPEIYRMCENELPTSSLSKIFVLQKYTHHSASPVVKTYNRIIRQCCCCCCRMH